MRGKIYLVWLAVGLMLSLPMVHQASASTVTELVTFSAFPFSSTFGQTPPQDPVTGSFTIIFDPTQTYVNSTSGITLNTLNISLGSKLAFDYSPTSQTINDGNTNGSFTINAHELIVGGTFDGPSGVQSSPPTDDFWLYLYTFTTIPLLYQLGYSQTSLGAANLFSTTPGASGIVIVTPIPLPPSLLLLGSGLMGLGALGWRRPRFPS